MLPPRVRIRVMVRVRVRVRVMIMVRVRNRENYEEEAVVANKPELVLRRRLRLWLS